jgi:hypothetical protein
MSRTFSGSEGEVNEEFWWKIRTFLILHSFLVLQIYFSGKYSKWTINYVITLVGRFAKLRGGGRRKTDLRHVRPAVRTHGIARLPLDGFLWNLIFEYFRKSADKIQVSLESGKYNALMHTLYEDQCTFMVLSRWNLGVRNISDKRYRENQDTHFMFSNFFPRNLPFMRLCGKIWYSPTGRITVD